jgi:hypothetical protein
MSGPTPVRCFQQNTPSRSSQWRCPILTEPAYQPPIQKIERYNVAFSLGDRVPTVPRNIVL